MGTIVILFVYLLSSLALPVFIWRRQRAKFSALRHLAVPALGAAALIVPFIELCKPGQPAPYNYFPYLALALAALAAVAAHVVVRRHPATGSGEGMNYTAPDGRRPQPASRAQTPFSG
jgi:amino acid transporter